MTSPLRRLRIAALLMGVITAIGIAGYRFAGLDWLDAVYQTMITLSTVGYHDMAPQARAFTTVMVAFGTLSLAVLISLVTAALIEVQISEFFGRRKVESKVRNLENHFIICGGGRFGLTIAAELTRKGAPFVIIEGSQARADEARAQGFLVLEADATEESSLRQAGLERARGLLTTLPSDADNVYVTLTARQLAPDVRVVSIALEERATQKLRTAGAADVVAPYQLGGNWMAQLVTSPNVADFMKMTTGAHPVDFYMDELQIAPGSPLSGKALKDTSIRSEFGVIVVAVKRAEGPLVTNPPLELELAPQDVLVCLGQHEQLASLKEMAQEG